jgi:hypothetical protein
VQFARTLREIELSQARRASPADQQGDELWRQKREEGRDSHVVRSSFRSSGPKTQLA